MLHPPFGGVIVISRKSTRTKAQNTPVPPYPKIFGTQESPSILYSFPHAIGAPGIGWTAWNQVTELVALGLEVHLVAASVARPIAGLASLTTTLAVGRLRIPHRVIGRDRALLWHDTVAARAVCRRRPSVVHTWPLAAVHTLRAARALGIPGLREAPNTHTAHAFEVVAAESARLGIRLPATASHALNETHLALEQSEWDAAAGILVPSDAVRTSFLERGFEPRRLLSHRYGYRPQGASAAPAARPDRPFTAIFLGRGDPRKGLHHALDAWLASSASEHGRFLVYGELLPDYRALLADRLAHESVEVLGFTSTPAEALAAADVLLLPTLEEGSALITYEAQAAGCVPLVSSAAGAVLDHGVHGLVHEPGDTRTLTAQLTRLDADPRYLARLRRASIAHAPSLTWSVAGVALLDAYRVATARTEEGAHVVAE